MTDTFGSPSNAYASKTIKIFCLRQQLINHTTTLIPYSPSATATTNLAFHEITPQQLHIK